MHKARSTEIDAKLTLLESISRYVDGLLYEKSMCKHARWILTAYIIGTNLYIYTTKLIILDFFRCKHLFFFTLTAYCGD